MINHIVLVVRDLDAATAAALGAIRSIRPGELRVVHPVQEPDGDVPYDLQERWRTFSGGIATARAAAGPDREPAGRAA